MTWRDDPGSKLYETEGLNREERLIDVYRTAWKKRYGDFPVVEGKGREVFEQLAKSFTYEKATKILEHYTTMNVAKFVETAHDPFTLKFNLNLVIASMAGKQVKGLPPGTRLMEADEVFHEYLRASQMVRDAHPNALQDDHPQSDSPPKLPSPSGEY